MIVSFALLLSVATILPAGEACLGNYGFQLIGEEQMNPCETTPCIHGRCYQTVSGYLCHCDVNGTIVENGPCPARTPCDSKPCGPNGQCYVAVVRSKDAYLCRCDDGTITENSSCLAPTMGPTSSPCPTIPSTVPPTTAGSNGCNSPQHFIGVTSGTITNPNYDGGLTEYATYRECSWIIHLGEYEDILITIESFDLEGSGCIYDWVSIYEGDSSRRRKSGKKVKRQSTVRRLNKGTLHATFCGHNIPAPLLLENVEESFITLEFHTDSSIEYTGFSLQFELFGSCPGQRCHDDPNICVPISGICNGFSECNDSSDEAYCPVGLPFFCNFSRDDCGFQHISGPRKWQYSSETGIMMLNNEGFEMVVSQMRLRFDQEYNNICVLFTYRMVDVDELSVMRQIPGTDGQFESVLRIVNSTSSNKWVRAKVNFTEPSTALVFEGVLTTGWYPYISIKELGETIFLTNSSGIIEPFKNNLSGLYSPHLDCQWIVAAKINQTVRLFFDDFNLEATAEWYEECTYDYITIYDGDNILEKFCSPKFPVKLDVVATQTGNITVDFHTDGTEESFGFRLIYHILSSSDDNDGKRCADVCFEDAFCLNETQRCDGTIDCSNGSDEIFCDVAECGRPVINRKRVKRRPADKKIVGGEEAVPGSWPWQAFIKHDDDIDIYYCGGSLISNQWVISAAHCHFDRLNPQDISRWKVTLGQHNLMEPDPDEERIGVTHVIVHHRYTPIQEDFDVVLMRLERPVEFKDMISPICLPKSKAEPGQTCFATGWGDTYSTDLPSTLLNQVELEVIGNLCNGTEYYAGEITPQMICAGYAEGGKDSCQGDSGGPLACLNDSGQWVLHGITSWGYGCALPKQPGVYTNVFKLSDWIKDTVRLYSK